MSESALENFRVSTRKWLEDNCPPTMRMAIGATPPESEDVWGGRNAVFLTSDAKLWLERAAARGFTAPTWPVEYGGAGLSPAEARILDEEMRRINCRWPLKSFGIWMLGPVLLEYGSEEQKQRFLPGIARGETRWCQGYSEPGAGSDLAGLQTKAILDGDSYVVSGQKIWTSHADKADWMFCLVRTNSDQGPSASKHEGIGFLLIDMATPGIRVRPILLISGASPFCETFFDEVRVPASNLVGKPGSGWTIAKQLLAHERTMMSQVRDSAVRDEESLHALAQRYLGTTTSAEADQVIAEPILRDRITQANLDFLCNQLTLRRSAEGARAGRGPGVESSMFKLYGTELNQRRKELKVLIEGYAGLGWEGPGFTSDELRYAREWLRSRANSIEGGTSEIQLNIIAKRVLGLPE